MTEDQTTTELDLPAVDAATADALESVSETEQVVDRAEDGEAAPVEGGGEVASAEDELALAEVEDAPAEVEDVPAEGEVASAEVAPFGDDEGVLSGEEVVVDDETMRRALEAILMVTDEPLPALTLARTVGRPTGDVTNALNELAGEYTEQGRGFDLREVGGGWRYYTRADAAQYVERFVLDGQQSRLTQAALETLAVVAYKQPVSRARVSAIRGVNVDGVMRTLISRGLVEEAGSDTESQATLYRTTSYFLERMGMQSLDDLPELAPYLPDMDDMEEELAAQNTAATAGEADATAGEADAIAAVAETGAVEEPVAENEETGGEFDPAEENGGELEPAEELEAGGDPVEADVDPGEIPAGEEDADSNDIDDDAADFDGAEGDSGIEDDADGSGAGEVTAESDADDEIDEDDETDEDDEDDERLPAAEDLEAAGAADGLDADEVADGSQYRAEADDRDE
ncbi:SMC-Scp complex subunit ScpB [Kribbella monticola]|uniref:SMC-Scp complex subunit ScpB n=1 Tax=Kribbella monticola TaxID=2185285 RepID=UPI001E37EF2C|nr:SMC-Scp complex subunit ScpB [Kribbella monticola]